MELDTSTGPRGVRVWLLVVCLPFAVGGALIPLTSLRRLGAPLWLASVAALLVFPLVPLAWHLVAERQRRAETPGPAAPLERLGLRSASVGLLVAAVSLSNLGERAVGAGLWALVRPPVAQPAAPRALPPQDPSARKHELEAFIPADATLVVALSDAAVLQPFLAREGGDAQKKLAALDKCQILAKSALVLIAVRDPGTRMVVVRAPGVTDPRNLYCLVGVMGTGGLGLRFTNDKPPIRFEVDGLLEQPLKFEAIDDRTVVMIDPAWAPTAGKKLFGSADGGPIGPVLGRVDRGASVWSASVTGTPDGPIDLALDARLDGGRLELRASSVPPTGEADKAELSMHVPLAFALALPHGALGEGIRGVTAVLAAAGAGKVAAPDGARKPGVPKAPTASP